MAALPSARERGRTASQRLKSASIESAKPGSSIRDAAVDAAARERLAVALDRDGVVAGSLIASQATGEAGPLSDIDLAVWVEPALSPRERGAPSRCALSSRGREGGGWRRTALVDAERLNARLDRLEHLIERLEAVRAHGEDVYLADEDLRAMTERRLQLAIQACIDVGAQLVTELSVPAPSDYAGVFTALAKAGVIDAQAEGRPPSGGQNDPACRDRQGWRLAS